MSDIHRTAQDGFSAGAGIYVVGRPDYPAALGSWLRDDLGIQDGARVLDLGAGTGKFLPRLLDTGATVVAVEPVDAMRAELSAAFPGVEARAGSADAIPFPDESFDAVVCAQSFHWFATAAALAEIRRVLKPGGALGLVWNILDQNEPWSDPVRRIMKPYAGSKPRSSGKGKAWQSAFPAKGFGELTERAFRFDQSGSPEDLIVKRTLSVSYIAALVPRDKAKVADRLRALCDELPALRNQAEITIHYDTMAYAARRLD